MKFCHEGTKTRSFLIADYTGYTDFLISRANAEKGFTAETAENAGEITDFICQGREVSVLHPV